LGAEDEKSGGGPVTPKDVKNEDRSGNVYENKGSNDNLPERKGDICAWLHAILHRSVPNLQVLTALLRLFEPFGTNPGLRDAETPAPSFQSSTCRSEGRATSAIPMFMVGGCGGSGEEGYRASGSEFRSGAHLIRSSQSSTRPEFLRINRKLH